MLCTLLHYGLFGVSFAICSGFHSLCDRLLHWNFAYVDISMARAKELYTSLAATIMLWRPKLSSYFACVCLVVSGPAAIHRCLLRRCLGHIKASFDDLYAAAGWPYGDMARPAAGQLCRSWAYTTYHFGMSIERVYGGAELASGGIGRNYHGMVARLSFGGELLQSHLPYADPYLGLGLLMV